MSLKPLKKSDLGKSWMKPRRDKNIQREGLTCSGFCGLSWILQ